MIADLYRWGWVFMGAGIVPSAFAAGPLLHDPFARPLLAVPGPNNPVTAKTGAEAEVPWNPKLTAVMVAGKNSLVNLDGTIIGIGEEKDGYRLVQVRDREAVFNKGKKRIVLKMETPVLQQHNELGGK